MKKLVVIVSILALILSFSVSAAHDSKINLNNECYAFGFKFGVSQWKWEKRQWWEWTKKEWNPNGDPWDTSVSGTHYIVDWNVGTIDDFGATGIVVKSAGKDVYAVNGISGTVTEDKPIEHITFCFKPQCGPSSTVCGNLICEGENARNCPVDCTGGG